VNRKPQPDAWVSVSAVATASRTAISRYETPTGSLLRHRITSVAYVATNKAAPPMMSPCSIGVPFLPIALSTGKTTNSSQTSAAT
jgi:hypothetical protein